MDFLALTLAGILSAGAPIVLATLGETLTERAGVINLSLDGTILLAAMTGFVLALLSGNPWLGLLASTAVGATSAAAVALLGLALARSQLAVGFILTLLCRDLAYFLGHNYARQLGPELPVWSIPGIRDLPFVGPALGYQSPVVYLSLLLTFFLWWWLFSTRAGLELRAVGEQPWAAFTRGIRVQRLRITYTLLGGALVGMAGGAFSLAVKPGWGRPQGAEGAGWIALAIVIFGGWHPLRAALGAYLFAALQVLGIHLQELFPMLPASLFQVAPFPVMILTLLLVNVGTANWFRDLTLRYPGLKKWLNRWQVTAPAALGRDFRPEKEA
ncbi:MAG: ABC transporter permease [Deltaproteobacteria bacterium]|nr:MAG: ABC transporter permease [Deltaproteobacteria bacterium]